MNMAEIYSNAELVNSRCSEPILKTTVYPRHHVHDIFTDVHSFSRSVITVL